MLKKLLEMIRWNGNFRKYWKKLQEIWNALECDDETIWRPPDPIEYQGN